MKYELEEAQWPQNSRVLIQGFVSNMDEWMRAVDALVTKAEPGTIAEATVRGLPVMLSGYLPEQFILTCALNAWLRGQETLPTALQ